MKKVILFLLTVALAVGALGFAHGVVSDSQDALLVYPTLEAGDPSALEGVIASMTFTCGDHLRWYTNYPFGGSATTEFVYDRKGTERPMVHPKSTMDVFFTGGMSSSVSGGEFSINGDAYGDLLREVVQQTPQGGSNTMQLPLVDYAEFYLPDYDLHYNDGTRVCDESASLHSILTGEYWNESSGCYWTLMDAFRFPVQPDTTISVTVEKDALGSIVGIGLAPENCPELHFLSDVNAEGIWFVPMFRDALGNPLPYESPAGHGIYFIPWKQEGVVRYSTGDVDQVTPDVENAALCFPLEESLRIDHMTIDAASGTARMLTFEDGAYFLTTCDLTTGTVRSRLELFRLEPDAPESVGTFREKGDHLLILAQGQIALTDAAGERLYLTAPDSMDQRFGGRVFDPDTGDLHFDGETLILVDSTWHWEGTFWAAAWRQGALRFYGEYDCSIMSGNDHWYYADVSAEAYPMRLHTP